MTEDSGNHLDNAKAFFDRGRQLAAQKNYDYAIEMYVEGLRCNPEDVENGHVPLRELALARQGHGGKKPTMMEKLKSGKGKMPLDHLLSAEQLFARDPDHIAYAESMLKAAIAGDFKRTARWIALSLIHI